MALAGSCLPTGFSYLSHRMPVEAVIELHGLAVLPSVAKAGSEGLFVYVLAEAEGLASVLVDEGC
jgi:hypothetical protein